MRDTIAERGKPSMVFGEGQSRRVELVKRFTNLKGKKILDLGCGIGTFSQAFYLEGAKVVGIDIEEEYLKRARLSFPHIDFVKGVGENLPFPDEEFQIVFCNEVLEHTQNDLLVLKEIFRVLQKDGFLFLFVPNKLFPFETHGFYWKGKYIFGNIPFLSWAPQFVRKKLSPHVKIYTRSFLQQKLQEIGFDLWHTSYLYPAFSRISKKHLRLGIFLQKMGAFLERTPLRIFGISIFVVARKPK